MLLFSWKGEAMRTSFFPLLIFLFIVIVILGLVFKVFFGLLVLAIKYWYIVFAIILIFMLLDVLRKRKQEEASKDYIETQYRVVDDEKDEDKKNG